MKKKKHLLLKLILIIFVIYAIFIIINQQQTLNQYSKNKEEIQQQIAEQNNYKTELESQKGNVDSMEFIEKTAREMCDMYSPLDTVYMKTK